MSALTNGPDTVTCITQIVVGQDRTGSNKLGPGPTKTYTGVSVQPAGLAAFGRAEDDRYGTQVNVDFVVLLGITPTWIGGPHSTVLWNGTKYDQVGVVRTYGRGRRTKHQEVKLKARGAEVK